jgi:hypothetical protein
MVGFCGFAAGFLGRESVLRTGTFLCLAKERYERKATLLCRPLRGALRVSPVVAVPELAGHVPGSDTRHGPPHARLRCSAAQTGRSKAPPAAD